MIASNHKMRTDPNLSAALHETLRRAARPEQNEPATAEALLPNAELTAALAQVAALQVQLDEATRSLPTPSRTTLRLEQELAGGFAVLRPDINWLRNSLAVIVNEYASRTGVWRAMAELPGDGARPNGWKSLRGAEKWWERHVSTGQDDTGRIYAHYDATLRSWRVLISWKAVQSRDVAWLRDQ